MVQDEESFRSFVQAHWGVLVRTGYLLTGDRGAAEDLVQTALEKTHRRWSRVERVDDPAVYVRRAMVNTATSWRRRLRPREVPLGPDAARSSDEPHQNVDDRDELWRALATLPPRTRAVLVLRYFEDLTEAQIAAVLGCSPGSVKSQASRGLERLRHTMRPDDKTLLPLRDGEQP